MHQHPLLAELFRDHGDWYCRIAAEDEGGFRRGILEESGRSKRGHPANPRLNASITAEVRPGSPNRYPAAKWERSWARRSSSDEKVRP